MSPQLDPSQGKILTGGNVMKGAGTVTALASKGVPTNGAAGEWDLTLGGATGGTFTLTTQDGTTAAIAFDAISTAVQAAVRALGGVSANFSASGTPGTMTLFNTYLAAPIDLNQLTVDGGLLTGGTGAVITIGQAGTKGSYGGSIKEGGIVLDVDSGTYYQNTNPGDAIPVYSALS